MTLRRQWTDKLQRQQLTDALPSRVRIAETEEREVVLESSEPSDLCEAKSIIKQLVIDQLVGSDSSIQAETNGLEKTSHGGVEMDQEADTQHQHEDASLEGENSSSEENEDDGCTRPGTVREDRRRKGIDRNEARRIQKMQEQRTGLHSEPHRGQRGHRMRRSSEGEPDSDDLRDKTGSVKSDIVTAAADAAQQSDHDVFEIWATPGDNDYVGSHHTAPKEREKQFHVDVSKTMSPNDDVSTAAFDETLGNYRYQIDEPLWAYIQFIDPQSHWDQKFTVFKQQNNAMVELTGSSADIDGLKRFCDTRRLKRTVKREMLRIPERCTVSAFLDKLQQLSSGKVLARHVDSCQDKYCELVGKKFDVDEVQKMVDSHYSALSDAKNAAKDEQPKARTEFVATADWVRTGMASAYHCNPQLTRTKPNFDDEFQFCTPMWKLMVKVITGDLLAQRCEILVNPSNSSLVHHVGLSKLLAEAAGYEMERECREYLHKYRTLKTTTVFDTTAGRMKPPVRRIIHACGPNVHETSDLDQCEELLEQTFFQCFILANDKQHAHSIAVPAISSGLPHLFLRLQPELKLSGVMDLISRNLLSSMLLL